MAVHEPQRYHYGMEDMLTMRPHRPSFLDDTGFATVSRRIIRLHEPFDEHVRREKKDSPQRLYFEGGPLTDMNGALTAEVRFVYREKCTRGVVHREKCISGVAHRSNVFTLTLRSRHSYRAALALLRLRLESLPYRCLAIRASLFDGDDVVAALHEALHSWDGIVFLFD